MAALTPGPEWLWVGLLLRAVSAGWGSVSVRRFGWPRLRVWIRGLDERPVSWFRRVSCAAWPHHAHHFRCHRWRHLCRNPHLWNGATSVGTQSYQLAWNSGVGVGVAMAPGPGGLYFFFFFYPELNTNPSLCISAWSQRPLDSWGQADSVRGLSRPTSSAHPGKQGGGCASSVLQ